MVSIRLASSPQRIYRFWSIVAIIIALSSSIANAQDAGVDVCGCSPSVFEFTFDFGLSCPPVNVGGPGIEDVACLISPLGNPNITDEVPVVVTAVDVLELDQDNNILVQENFPGNYLDGATFTYTSVSATNVDVDASDVPKAIQLNILGQNAAREPLLNFFQIVYTSDCTTFPILTVGQSAGWTVFTDLGLPRPELCPVVPTPGPNPTNPPTDPPVEPTDPPVGPTDPPVSPTESPVAPTDPPVTPTEPPVEPTSSPVVPTDPPVPMPTTPPVLETEAPTEMSFSYNFGGSDDDVFFGSRSAPKSSIRGTSKAKGTSKSKTKSTSKKEKSNGMKGRSKGASDKGDSSIKKGRRATSATNKSDSASSKSVKEKSTSKSSKIAASSSSSGRSAYKGVRRLT